jgi:hypothetical protein
VFRLTFHETVSALPLQQQAAAFALPTIAQTTFADLAAQRQGLDAVIDGLLAQYNER